MANGRLTDTLTKGPHVAKVRNNKDWGEWFVEWHPFGKHRPQADTGHQANRQDALDTAQAMLNHGAAQTGHSSAPISRHRHDGKKLEETHDLPMRKINPSLKESLDKSHTKIPKVSNLYEAYAKVYAQDTLGLELEENSGPDISVRSLYAKTYAKHGGTIAQSENASEIAYAAVRKKFGKEAEEHLRLYHDENENFLKESRTSGTRRDSGRGKGINVHRFRNGEDDGQIYDYTQTATMPDGRRSKVRNGDILVMPDGRKGVMLQAWPVDATHKSDALHHTRPNTGSMRQDVMSLVSNPWKAHAFDREGIPLKSAMRMGQTVSKKPKLEEETQLDELIDPVLAPAIGLGIGSLVGLGVAGYTSASNALNKRRERLRNRKKLEENWDDDREMMRDIRRSQMTTKDIIDGHYAKADAAFKAYNELKARPNHTRKSREAMDYFNQKYQHHHYKAQELAASLQPSRSRTPSNWNYQGD